MTESHKITRRTMLASGAAALAAPTVLNGATLESEPLRIGQIGVGTRGIDLIRYLGQAELAKVVAVCDVYKPHTDRGVKHSGNDEVKTYEDYRDLIADKDVEAVVIATPDHWHEQMVLDACHAGKHVYCEKGWTMSVDAVKRMRAAVKNAGITMQLGHQGRQFPAAKEAGRLIRDGAIGELPVIRVGRVMNSTPERPCWRWYGYYNHWKRPDPTNVIKQLDWERWLGPAPKIDFNERHFWHWRCYWPYGTGQAGDLLSHEMDYVQSVLGWGIPDTCMCTGYNAVLKDDRTTPDTWTAIYHFEDHNCTATFEGTLNGNMSITPTFCGNRGNIIFNRIGQSASRFYLYGDNPYTAPIRPSLKPRMVFDASEHERWPNHMDNFLLSARTGKPPRCNEDEAFIECVTFLMSVESYRKKRMVRWDRQKEEIV